MKNGYNDFFKSAREASANGTKPNSGNAKPGTREQQNKAASQGSKRPIAKKPAKSFVGILSLGAVASLTALYINDPSIGDRIQQHIEIGFMPKSEAAEAKKTEPTPAEKEKSAETKVPGSAPESEASAEPVAEDTSYITKLNQRKTELDQREVALNELEAELHNQRLEIEERIRQLEQLRTNLSGMLQDKVQVDDERVTKLVEFYANMKPKQAAEIISTVNEDLAVEILGRMKKKNAAEIMNLLPAKKAQMFSERYAGYAKK